MHGSLWLLTAPADSLQRLIGELAARLHAPAFAPHVTLLGDLAGDVQDLKARARGLAAQLAPLDVAVVTARGYGERFRALVLDLEATPALIAARKRAEALFGTSGATAFNPHLSLAYGDIEPAQAAQLAAGLASPPQRLRFDRLALTNASAHTPIERWRLYAEFGLAAHERT